MNMYYSRLSSTVCSKTSRWMLSDQIKRWHQTDKQLFDDDIVERTLTLPSWNFCSNRYSNDKKTITLRDLTSTFSNFSEAKAYYKKKVLDGNKDLMEIYVGNAGVERAFQLIFPELVENRGITLLRERDRTGQAFTRWCDGNNQVEIELETEQKQSHDENIEYISALFVGGPSTRVAAVLYQMRYPDERIMHICTDRFDSNHDGSASHYHQRHAVPLYAFPHNRGHYYLYIDLYKRLISKEKLVYLAETDRNHVILSLAWSNIKFRYIFTIFLPYLWHMTTDIWLLSDKKRSKMAQSMEHSFRTVPVVKAISKYTGLPVESMLLRGKNKSNSLTFDNRDDREHFIWLNKYARFPFNEISCIGFGSNIQQVINFPDDGILAPMVIDNLKMILAERAQKSNNNEINRSCFQLKKLYVKSDPSNRTHIRVSSVECINTNTLQRHRIIVDRLFISLGPSGSVSIKPPKLSWWQHALHCMTKRYHHCSLSENGGYTPTLKSFGRHTLNVIHNSFFRGTQCLKDFAWAAGCSSVLMLGVDLQQTSKAQLDVFGRFLEGPNQHWSLIAQRDVTLYESTDQNASTKYYRFFAIQMTGGGNFPSRFAKPEYLVNLLAATEKIYDLEMIQNHAVYDIVQSRSCGRAVSAQNTIAFEHLAENAVINYALGGIGMTTMFSNGEKMIQMVEQQDSLLTLKKKTSTYMKPPETVLDGINYSYMIGDPYKTARVLGFNDSMSTKEKQATYVVISFFASVIVLSNNFF